MDPIKELFAQSLALSALKFKNASSGFSYLSRNPKASDRERTWYQMCNCLCDHYSILATVMASVCARRARELEWGEDSERDQRVAIMYEDFAYFLLAESEEEPYADIELRASSFKCAYLMWKEMCSGPEFPIGENQMKPDEMYFSQYLITSHADAVKQRSSNKGGCSFVFVIFGTIALLWKIGVMS